MKQKNNNRGITLISLVVTIIVLLILAGIGVVMLTGENSIIKKVTSAKGATSEAEAKEKVELEVLGSLDNKGNIIKEKLKGNIRDNLGVQDNQIVDPNEEGEFNEPFDFPLGDYEIRVNPNGDVETMPKGEIPTPPTLSEGDITFSPEPSTLTNKEVKVTIKAKVSTMRLTLQYALEKPDEENSWQTYTGPVTFKDNGPIYARLINEKGEKSNYTTGNVENIDKGVPTITSFTANQETATSSTVEVTVEANDDRELAGKNTYKFFAKEEGPATISLEEDTQAQGYKLNGTSTEGTYTYKGLTQGKSYTLKVIVTDEAGNTAELTTTVNTTMVPSLEEPSQEPEESPDPSASPDPSLPQTPKLTFKYEPNTWNNKEQVTVTLQLSEELQSSGYNLQYSLDNNDWRAYEPAGFTIKENGSIYARLIDDNNQTGGVATSTYTFFDRKAPNVLLKADEKTQNEITLNVTASDTPSGLAEENPISYYIIEGRVTDLTTAQSKKGEAKESSENKTYTYTELKPGTVYTLLVEVTDKAGNTASKTLAVSTENLPGSTIKPTTEGKDTNSDGKIDSWDTNGDGIYDAKDTTGDGNADQWLKDPTNPTSGWTDKKDQNPQPQDTNKDGLPDTWVDPKTGETVAEDTDNDGNADKFKDPATGEMKESKDQDPMPQDTTGNGLPDTWVDKETGEVVAQDTKEVPDGKADKFADENGNLTDKDEEGKTIKDTDGDGIPDARVDEEGNVENKENPKEPESPWVPDESGKDTDGDGIVDQYDQEKYPEGTKKTWDTDNDGEDDAVDTTGDGKADKWKDPDTQEWKDTDKDDQKQWDTNGDGVPDAKDTTGDDNADEWLKDPTSPESGWTDKSDEKLKPEDTNGDGLPDQWKDPEQGDKVVAKDTKKEPDGKASEFVDPTTGEFKAPGAPETYPKPEDTNGDGLADTWKDEKGNVVAQDTKEEPDGKANEFADPATGKMPETNPEKPTPETYPKPEDTTGDGLPDTWKDEDGKVVAKDTTVPPDGKADSFVDPVNPDNGWTDHSNENVKPEDKDGDGVPDRWVDENGEEIARDNNGDGKADEFKNESGDFSNKDEQGNTLLDTTGDGIPDTRVDEQGNVERKEDPKDPDSAWEKDETGKDTNKDGIIDEFNPEKYPEDTKQTWDTDGDGEDDAVDTTGDGKADKWKDPETQEWKDTDKDDHKQWDTNGDGIPDAKDTTGDENADEWLTDPTNPDSGWSDKSDEKLKPEDTNGDGLPDQWKDPEQGNKVVAKDEKEEPDGKANKFDNGEGELTDKDTDGKTLVDTDGDGIPDAKVDEEGNVERKPNPKDPESPWVPDNRGTDENKDGIIDKYDDNQYPKDTTKVWDTDGDGKDDAADTDGDGNADQWKDPKTEEWKETDSEGNKQWDTDGDGIPDARDTDDDDRADEWLKDPSKPSGGTSETDENGNKYVDTDNDGKPDAKVDPDSGDVKEVIDPETGEWAKPEEAKGKPTDTDKDSIIDTWDYNNDSKPDAWDKVEPKTGKPDTWDTDFNDKEDAWDTNNDGLADIWDTDGDEKPDAWDTDFDGIPDAFDTDNSGGANEWEFPAEEGSITFTDKPDTWTNTPVEVTLKSDYTAQGFTIEYSKDYDPLRRTGEWTASETATLDQNGTIYARLKKNDTEETGGVLPHKVTNIDKTNPTVTTKTSNVTTNSATLNVTAKDNQSGLAKKDTYKYYLIEGEVSNLEQVNDQKGSAKETSTNSSYKYTKLKENGKYTLVVDVSDEVGNVTTDFKTIQATKIPDLDQAEITFGYSNENWNNDPSVHVTISTGKDVDTKNYDLQYQTPNETNSAWQNYTEAGFDITKNGSIFARLKEKDGDQGSEKTATSNYSKFDREIPELSEISITNTTTNKISVSVTATDKPDDNPSGLLEENAFTYVIDQTANVGQKPSETEVTATSNEQTHEFTNLTHGTNYTITVKVSDKAKNVATKTTTVDTTTMPSLTPTNPDLPQQGNITFNYEPSSWNNKEQATVLLQLSGELQSAGYNLQYSLDNDEWKPYEPTGFTITENQAVYARLMDDNSQTGGVATSNYSFFDRKAPGLTLKVGEKTQNEITLNVTATDTPSGLAEGSPISYYLIEGRVADLATAQSKKGEAKESSENKTYTYTELKTGTVYTLLVEVTDKAGNKTAKMVTASTESIPGTTTKPTTEGTDTDNNGKIDSWDTNGDDIPDAKDTTGDGNADQWLKDPTNPSSGWTDKKDQNPQPKDTNKDGLPDTWVDPETKKEVAKDKDGDGVADQFVDPSTGELKDAEEFDPMPQDTTGNGLPDTWVDKETGEVVAQDTKEEPDGKADKFADENGDLTNKDEEGKTLKDTDGDGVPDARVDEEGNVENKENPKEPDSPWVPDESGKDTDGDGVVDDYDNQKYPEGTKKTWDTDGDGEDDAVDTTGDGNADQWKKEDGTWSDKNEDDKKQWDTNGDGIPDARDTTGNDNADEWLTDPTSPESGWTDKSDEKLKPEDTNGDGLPDQWKDPEQGDKVVAKDDGEPKTGNATEFVDPKTGEFPDPGTPEKYPKPEDTNGDGLADKWVDKDGETVAEDRGEPKTGNATDFADPATGKMPEKAPEKPTPETYPKPEDTNGDGLPDTWKDKDDNIVAKDDKEDPDGNPNKFVDPTDPEGPNKDGDNLTDTDEDGNKYQDNDRDGIPDVKVDPDSGDIKEVVDPETGEWKDPEEVPGKPTDTTEEKDGIPDEWDYNNDTKPDAWDTNGDGKPDKWDTDYDGTPDAWDTDFDGIPDAFGKDNTGSATEWEFPAEEGSITFTDKPDTWTNTPVEVTLKSEYTAQGFTIEYSKDYNPLRRTGEWTASETATLDQNGTIYARLKKNGTEEAGGVLSHKVTNIDKTDPTVSVNVTGTNTNSATLNVTASDKNAGLEEKAYTYYLINGEVTDKEQVKEQKGSAKEGPTAKASYKYTGLKQGETYTLVVEVKDKAGNITTESATQEIGKIPGVDKEGDITFKYSNDNWNNEDSIHVTISTGESVDTKNYDLQYQTPAETTGETWQNYTESGFDITKNGSIFARLKEKDGDQSGATASSSYSKFDRDDPTVSLKVDQRTTTSIKVTATGSDGEGSGIKKYEFYEGANLKDTQETSERTASYTYDSLTPGEAYSLKVVITDNVERTGEATANADETKTIPDLNQEGSINFEYTPDQGSWTNDKVNVKATSKYTDEYKIEYSTEEPESWQEYTADGFNVEEENGKFKVRLKQQAGELTTAAIEKEITWIDKTAPELSITGEPQISTNSAKISINVSDELSQLKENKPIKYYKIKGEVTQADEIQAQKGEPVYEAPKDSTTYTYISLEQGTTYTLVVEAEDNAENVATQSKVVTIGKVPGLDQVGDIDFQYDSNEWNNREKVHVTLKTKTPVDAAFKLQYKVTYTSPRPETDKNVEWTDYGDGFDITNNATINARITEKEGTQSGATATTTYTLFDRELPELSEISVTKFTTNSISVSVTAKDKPDQGASGLLDENAYTYMIDTTENMNKVSSSTMIMGEPMGASDTLVTESSSEPTHTFTGLTHNTDYTIRVMVMDKAQNMANQEKTQTTEKIPDLSQGAISFDVTPSSWNNKDQATVRLNPTDPIDETKFTLQYQTPKEENTDWQNYNKDSGFTIKNNGSIFARLIEKEGKQTGTVATHNYNYFDRKNPDVTIEADEPTVTSVNVRITDSKDEESAPGAKDNSGLDDTERYSYWLEEADGDPKDSPVWIGTDESHNYEGLLQGKKYNLKVEAKDKAGNKGTSNVVTITTKTIPDLNEEGALEATYEPATWTNAVSVKVTLKSKYTEQGYVLRYSTNYEADVPEWKEYTDAGFEITNNQKFAVKLELKGPEGTASQYGKAVIKEVKWIDRDAPVLSIVGEPAKTTNSISVNVTASDALSQLKDETPIKYYLINGEVTGAEQIQAQKGEAKASTTVTNNTFTGLTQATTYTVVVEAEDRAGNIATQSKVVTTEKVPDLNYETNITYAYVPDSWTKTPPVTVTLNPQKNIDEGFTLQYGTSTTDAEPTVWTDYENKPFQQNENCTIYTRLKEKDGNQVGKSAKNEMKLIDTQAPSGTLKVSSYSTNSLSVTVENPGDTLSGLHATETYTYSIYQGATAEGVAQETKAASTSATASFSGLTQNTEYTVKVVIKDKAGNTADSTVTQTIKQVPALAAGDITFTYDTNEWTNKTSVKVTLSAKDSVDLNTYKLQYQTPAETDSGWHDYPAGDTGFNITTNGSIFARLIEKSGTQTGGTATAQYSWFDRQAPTAVIKVTGTTNSNTINVSAEGTTDTVGELTATPYVFSIYQGTTAEGVETKETKPAQAANTTSFTGLTHGTQYTIKVEVTDKATNTGSKTVTEKTVAIPDLSTSGFTFSYTPNGPTWTNTDVTIKANPDYLSDANFKLQMKSDSKSSYVDYTSEGFKISTNEKVYAQLVEKNGTQRGVEAQGQVTWIDKQPPTVDPLSTDTNVTVGETTIDITDLNATDTASGIKSFAYYVRPHSDAEWSTEVPKQTNTKNAAGSPNPVTDSYQFTDLADGTAYDIMVKVSDNASTETVVNLDNIMTEKSGPKVGDYVKYEPSGGSTTYPSEQAHNGYKLQNIDREKLNWRILSIDENTIKIISNETTGTVTYSGSEGYNNVVKDLNDMCKTLYSHETAEARSVNLEEFIGQPGVDQSTGSGTYDRTAPAIWPLEKDAGGTLGQSEQTSWISGTVSTNIYANNYWHDTYRKIPSTSPLYSTQGYFLSSRCMFCYTFHPVVFGFEVQYWDIEQETLSKKSFLTYNGDFDVNGTIRAVVTLPTTCTFGNEAGDEENPITINWNDGSGSSSGGGTEETIPEDTSYIGYYADLDGDTSTAEGIIYADLGEARSGRWNIDEYGWSNYSYSKGSNLKKYKVGTNNVTEFGSWSKPIVSEITGTGENDRFYVMSLSDFDSNRYSWYKSAYGKLENPVDWSENDFGMGKTNTTTEIENWTNEYYGTQDSNDMWGVIKNNLIKYEKTWFVPSKAEWAAFGDMCWTQIKMDESTYPNFGLNGCYWSSTLCDANFAYRAPFKSSSYWFTDYALSYNPVRLSTTF